ncbi:MAG: UvrD-helicase domain-containing protein [Planctomycetota bacterium]
MGCIAVADHQLIRASAGSGKTYRLSGHFLRQLFLKNPPETILATTFTRKAAGEILGRVLTRLARGAESDAEAAKLAAALELPQLTAATASELLTQLTRNLHRMRVCTLDSYFQQAARSMTLELGLMPGWSILDEHLDQELREQSIDAVLSQQLPEDAQNLMHMLAKGHSKRSVRDLIDSTIRDYHELFQRTSEAAWQLIPAGQRLTDARQQALLEAMLAVELTDRRFIKARDADIQRFRDRNWDDFPANGMAVKVLSGDCLYYKKEISAPLCAIYRELNQHAAAELLQRWSQQMQAIRSLIARFDREYAKLRTEQGWMRFSDVTRVLAHSAAADGERLNFRLDSALRCLLLDEFQDTSSDQWSILRRLTESIVAQGSRGSIFCVGDGKQAIYGWRGGVAEILDAVADAVPGIQEAPLNQSRRSSAVVIETVNRVFMNLKRHDSLEELQDACHRWSENFPEHSTVHTDLPGRVEFRSSPRWETEDSSDRKGPWYRWVAQQIQQQHLRTPGASIGVLTRDNKAVSWLVYELTMLGVPASEEGGTPPKDSPAVLAVMSALQLASHPACTVSRFHVANSPLGPVIGLTDWEDDELAVTVADSLRRKLLEDGYGNTLEEWARVIDADCSARDRLRLSQVVAEGWSFEELGALDPSDFVRLLEQSRFQRSEPAAVRVMTVHQSKGLEFDIVVLPQLDAKLFKHPQAAWTGPSPAAAPDRVCIWVSKELRSVLPQNLQEAFADTTARMVTESLCLFYVALTRARHALLLLTPPITQKTLPGTFAGLLMATLTDKQQAGESELLYEAGAENWSEQLPQLAVASATQITPRVSAAIPAIRLAKPLPCRERGLPRRTPSQHDRVPAASSGVALDPAAKPSAAAAPARTGRDRHSGPPLPNTLPAIDPRLRGIVFHAGFEALEWLSEAETPDPALLFARLRQQVQDQSLTTALLQRLLDEFLQSLKLPAVRRIFNRDLLGDSPLLSGWCDAVRAGRAEVVVDRERSFVRIHDGALIQGTIDRLVLVREGDRVVAADVVDFKTDRKGGDADVWRREKAEHYAGQLEEYRSAVRHMTSSVKLPVSTRLLLIEDASVVEVRGA